MTSNLCKSCNSNIGKNYYSKPQDALTILCNSCAEIFKAPNDVMFLLPSDCMLIKKKAVNDIAMDIYLEGLKASISDKVLNKF